MTKTRSTTRTDSVGFPVTDCSRCGGSGFYSIGQCFGCSGSGLQYRRGNAAKAAAAYHRAQKAVSFPVTEALLPGDRITRSYTEGRVEAGQWLTIAFIEFEQASAVPARPGQKVGGGFGINFEHLTLDEWEPRAGEVAWCELRDGRWWSLRKSGAATITFTDGTTYSTLGSEIHRRKKTPVDPAPFLAML